MIRQLHSFDDTRFLAMCHQFLRLNLTSGHVLDHDGWYHIDTVAKLKH